MTEVTETFVNNNSLVQYLRFSYTDNNIKYSYKKYYYYYYYYFRQKDSVREVNYKTYMAKKSNIYVRNTNFVHCPKRS